MIRVSIASVLFLVPALLSGQTKPAEFLQTAAGDAEVRSLDQRIEFLKAMPFRLAPIQRMEFRTRNNQLDPSRQDYALRITPTNPWEARSNNRYFQEYEKSLHLERELAFKRALHTRYTLLVETAYENDRYEVLREAVGLGEILLSAQNLRQASREFDSEDLLKAHLDLMEMQLEMDEAAIERTQRWSEVASCFSEDEVKEFSWRLSDLATPRDLPQRADSLLASNFPGGETAYYESRVSLAASETAVQKSNLNLGFLQAQYEPYRTEQDREPWSLSLGFVIPIFNPNKGDVAEGKLDEMEAQFEFDEVAYAQRRDRKLLSNRLKGLVEQFGSLADRQGQLEKEDIRKAIGAGIESNPILAIRYRQSLLKLSEMKLKLHRQILLTYVELLDRCEALQQQPVVNYLER